MVAPPYLTVRPGASHGVPATRAADMSRPLQTPPRTQASLSTQRHGPAHMPAITPRVGVSIGFALIRMIAPGVADWYLPRRQLINNELRKLKAAHNRGVGARLPQPTSRQLRFNSF